LQTTWGGEKAGFSRGLGGLKVETGLFVNEEGAFGGKMGQKMKKAGRDVGQND